MAGILTPGNNHGRRWRRLIVLVILILAGVVAPTVGQAGETLSRVQARRQLNCGVSDGRVGFSSKDSTGRWTGLDADFCRAIAAAVIGDVAAVKFVPLSTSARFLALRSNEIDILARNTTWTIGREIGLGVHFVGTLFYDGEGFMARAAGRARKIADLNGANICVLERTTTEDNLSDYFGSRGWKYRPVVAKTPHEARQAFFSGKCASYTADRSSLAAERLTAPGGAQAYIIFSEQISQEPLGPAIKRGDEDWLVLLRWIYFAIIAAEEFKVTSNNLDRRAQNKSDLRLAKFLDHSGAFAKQLNLKPGWVRRIIGSVGNYQEMFERNLGQGSVLKLDRGPNRLWTEGGLLYAPPFL